MVRRFIALAFALGSVVVVAVTVELMVTGPLGDARAASRGTRDGRCRTRPRGRSCAGRCCWPIVVGFLVCLYRFSANVRHRWRDCLPGALVGAVLWIVAAVAFRAHGAGLRDSSGVAADDPTVQIIGQSVNAVIATVLWAYLASIAILLGGEFNVLLRDRREAQRNTVVGFPFV